MGDMNKRRQDFELLQCFARQGDQRAFADVVRQHLDLVYATALRKLEDAGAAQEVAQNVFTTLARKAWQFAPDDSLPAWLHKTALLESKSWLRGELRRRRREQTAAELGTTMNTPDEQPAFNALVPLLDEALLSLREKDRTALLLRFYETQSLRDVGASLGIGEDAAQKRVASALERLSQFFQRHGFKTATASAMAAALQSTATSASAATATLVINSAMLSAPPALVGLSALLARFASLTKVQTAAVCLMVVAAPVMWQISERGESHAVLTQTQSRLASVTSEINYAQSELHRLAETGTRLEDSIAKARETAARSGETLMRFEEWKTGVRARLLAADYQWPDDLPFVRIPKSIVPRLRVDRAVLPPGEINLAGRQLLGLSPTEREQLETALHRHFDSMESLMQSHLYQTNQPARIRIPSDAVASLTLGVPPLGESAEGCIQEVQSNLKSVLGEERWQLLEPQLKSTGTDTLRRILGLDAAGTGQEVALYIREQDGIPTVSMSWADQTSMFNTGGLNLNVLAQDTESNIKSKMEEYLGSRGVPEALTRPLNDWLNQQIAARVPQPKHNP